MPSIGPITVPQAWLSPTPFPLITDFAHVRVHDPLVVVHRMGPESANGKIEQRYYVGPRARTFTVRREAVTPSNVQALMTFWEANHGPEGEFGYDVPNEDGTFTQVLCRFKDKDITLEYVTAAICSTGVDLLEVSYNNPVYTSAGTQSRFPSGALSDALIEQVQEFIPLVKIEWISINDPNGARLIVPSGAFSWTVDWDDDSGNLDFWNAQVKVDIDDNGDATLTWTGGGSHDYLQVGYNGSPLVDDGRTLGKGPISLGNFSPDDEIQLELYNTVTANTWVTGEASRNGGKIYARVAGGVQANAQSIYLSDRYCAIDGDDYQPRLLEIPQIDQSLNGASDAVQFKFGNADRVMTQLANALDLFRKKIEFSLYHVNTDIKLDLWTGEIRSWNGSSGSEVFTVQASDSFYELTQNYPRRKMTRTCWKIFDNAGNGCPFASAGNMQTTRTLTQSDQTTTMMDFTPSASSCDKSWDGPNGCLAHGMDAYFGGIIAKPQTVITTDNSTGVKGLFRDSMTSASLVSDSIYGQPLPEVYCDVSDNVDVAVGFPVACAIVEGRDEGDFYCALGVVGEGPVGEFAQQRTTSLTRADGTVSLSQNPHKLDGQDHHGFSDAIKHGEQYPDIKAKYGLRMSIGMDPATNHDGGSDSVFNDSDKFSLGEGGSGIQRYGPERAAGTAFIEIRRMDEKGLQLSRLSDHDMQTAIRKGISGYTWEDNGDGTFTRQELSVLTNPIWICVNMLLKARGVWFAPDAVQQQHFDVKSCADASTDAKGNPYGAALICDLQVPAMLGATGNETQFRFQGAIKDLKPLRDWFQEILANCLGYFVPSAGRIKFGIRANSSAVEAYDDSNIIWDTLDYQPLSPSYNHITGNFLDGEYGFAANSVSVYDETHAQLMGSGGYPEYTKIELNLNGTNGKSQCARIVTTRLREELGGFRPKTFQSGRRGTFKTTLLGLASEPGQVIRIDHRDLPDYPATSPGALDPGPARANSLDARIERWQLNPDLSIDVEFKSCHNEVYDLVYGPKPADVDANVLPIEDQFPVSNWKFEAYTKGDGKLRLERFAARNNAAAVHQGFFELMYRDERQPHGTTSTNLTTTTTTFNCSGPPAQPGEWVQVESEIMGVVSYTPVVPNHGTLTVSRGAFGTQAVPHTRRFTTIQAINPDFPNEMTVDPGLDLKPGEHLVLNDGTTPVPQQPIASYDSVTGKVVLILPLDLVNAGVGDSVYADPRLWLVRHRQESIPFPPRWFRSGERSTFEHVVAIPGCGIALVIGKLYNTRGQPSEPVYVAPTGVDRMTPVTAGSITSTWPHVIRTHDNLHYQFPYEDLRPLLPTATDPGVVDAFEPAVLAETQTFKQAYAEIPASMTLPPDQPPIDFPATPTTTTHTEQTFVTITLGGTVDSDAQIHIEITGDNEVRTYYWRNSDWLTTTLNDAADAIRDWLNAHAEFNAFYTAESNSGTVEITARIAHGGTVIVDVTGPMTATVSGTLSGMGITAGRRYAIVYTDGAIVSSPSPLTPSTGPAVSASSIEIAELPASGDSRVTDILIYATPDGEDAPLYLVGTVPNGSEAFTDSTPEATLNTLPVYTGASQPQSEGHLYVRVKWDGHNWFDLFIPQGAARSNVVDGYAIAPREQGAEITADLKYILVANPTAQRPGWPVDVRLVVE